MYITGDPEGIPYSVFTEKLSYSLNICFRLPAGRNFSLSLDENTSLIAFLDSPVSILRTLMAVSDRYDCKIAVS